MGNDTGRRNDSTDQKQERTGLHQEKLNEAVNSGGGCLEAWNAARDVRGSNRRSFMLGAAASLIGASSMTTVSAEETADPDPDKETNKLSKTERRQLAAEARSDDRVIAMWKELTSQGFKPNLNSATGYKTTYKDREWRFVRIPFETKSGDALDLSHDGDSVKAGAIIWNTADEIEPHGYITSRTVNYEGDTTEVERNLREEGVNTDSMDTIPVTITQKPILPVDEGNVDQETLSRTIPIGIKDRPSVLGCECNSAFFNPLTNCAPCGIPDTGCVADLAEVYAVEIASCGTCVASTGWLISSCAVCVASIIEEDDFGFFCCPCEACDGWIC